MGIFIDGFGISGYRSFGKNIQRVGPLSKINIFAGQNNSGKSNILSYLMYQYGAILNSIQTHSAKFKLDGLDIPMNNWDRIIRVDIGITHNSEYYNNFLGKESLQGNLSKWLDTVLKSNILSNGTGVTWLPFEAPPNQAFSLRKETIDQLAAANLINFDQWQRLWITITSQGRGGLKEHWIPQTLEKIAGLMTLPTFSIIPSVRRYSAEKTDKTDDFSGLGIIDKLAKLQNPGYREQVLKDRFQKINNFVRNVTGNQTATLEIPYDRDTILVHMDNKVLPLTSLGTGIHEVIILAAAATILTDQIVCIEEPELHMHPELQKKFIEYLEKETTNQYFITTHSASILDRPSTSIFHVSINDGVSAVTPVSSPAQRFSVCMDLGYRASDLVQSNCIIWVEGPSDRIYLKWWISSLDLTLIEGIHYSIMFYGGRLLSHLTANDPEVEEFISLRRLNRHVSIVIDSDRKLRQKNINETKKRVQAEIEASSGLVWITAGREIESYIDRNSLEVAAKEIHPSIDSMLYRTKYDDPLNGYTKAKSKVTIDKIKLAHKIVQNPANWEILDLQEKTKALVDFIRISNRLDKLFVSNVDEIKSEVTS
jgi:predicted ATP-dependent endonuclease of OLD family